MENFFQDNETVLLNSINALLDLEKDKKNDNVYKKYQIILGCYTIVQKMYPHINLDYVGKVLKFIDDISLVKDSYKNQDKEKLFCYMSDVYRQYFELTSAFKMS